MSHPYPGPPPGPQPQQPYGWSGMPVCPAQPGIPAAAPPYADWGTRFLGYLIDAGIPAVVLFTGIFLIDIIAFAILAGTNGSTVAVVVLGMLLIVLVVASIWFNIWNLAYRRGRTGQTLGQRVVKIKTVDEYTLRPIGFGKAFVRQLVHILDSCIIGIPIGWLAPLWEQHRQTWADRIMHTVVIHVDPAMQGAAGLAAPGMGAYPQATGGYSQQSPYSG